MQDKRVTDIYFCGKHQQSNLLYQKIERKFKTHFLFVCEIPTEPLTKTTEKELFDKGRNWIDIIVTHEKKIKDRNTIQFGCILDVFAWLKSHFHSGSGKIETLLTDSVMKTHLEQYRQSLIVWISDENQENFLDLFKLLSIPYVKIPLHMDVLFQLQMITDAYNGEFPFQAYFDKQKNQESHEHIYNFAFFKPQLQSKCIKTISISENKSIQEWTSWGKSMSCRFVEKYDVDNLAAVAFHVRINSICVKSILKNGIQINGKVYNFLGCSSGGLKKRKCYLWQGSKEEIQQLLSKNGNFSTIAATSKRMARIGLLFSGVQLTSVRLSNEDILQDKDIERNHQCFSDGCGAINMNVAVQLYKDINCGYTDGDYLPSVFQIRFQGYKGVVMVDPSLTTHKIKLRPSMRKFETECYDMVCVCDYSKSCTYGHLNRQYITLLSGLGVKDEVFLDLQKEHFEILNKVGFDLEKTLMFLQWQKLFDIVQYLINSKVDIRNNISLPDVHKTKLKSCLIKMLNESDKLRILVPNSRNLFGVCDDFDILQYGECYVRITDGNQSYPRTIKGQVIVCKNPCYHLGDVRVLTAVAGEHTRKLEHLKDCIVFPARGERPHANEIAGSDLDGDQFFVSWEEKLIPPSIRKAYEYPAASNTKTLSNEDDFSKEICYFSVQNETQKLTANVDRLFKLWADFNNVTCDECFRLAMLFSRVIDSSKSGEKIIIPKDLATIENKKHETKYVWQKMDKNVEEFKEFFNKQIISEILERNIGMDVTDEILINMLGQSMSGISEFEKLKFVMNCITVRENNKEKAVENILQTFIHLFNFTFFTIEEKREALLLGLPFKIFQNAIYSSRILSEREIDSLGLSGQFWKFYLRSNYENFDWDCLTKALSHENCLLLLQLPDYVSICIKFLRPIKPALQQIVPPGSISAIYISSHFQFQQMYTIGNHCPLDFSDDTFQLYHGNRNGTFIYLKKEDSMEGHGLGCQDETKFLTSVDLTKFSDTGSHNRVRKLPFVFLEIYVQSGSNAYMDVINVNDEDFIEEVDIFEEDGATHSSVNIAELFPDKQYPHIVKTCTLSELERKLQQDVKQKDLQKFYADLCMWLPQNIPDVISSTFLKLLEEIVFTTYPLTERLPSYIEEAVLNIVVILNFKNILILVQVASMLCRLQLEKCVIYLIQEKLESIAGLTDFLDIVMEWHHWVYMNEPIAKLLLLQMKTLVESVSDIDDTEERMWKHKYIVYFTSLHQCELLQDIDSAKNIFKNLQASSYVPNLKIKQTEDISCFSFYCIKHLSYKPHFKHGQYVLISRQVDVKSFQDSRALCCVGKVEYIGMVPFLVQVSIHGRVPDVIYKALQSEKPHLFMLSRFANMSSHTRILNSMKQLVTKESNIFKILYHSWVFSSSHSDTTSSKDFETFKQGKDKEFLADLNVDQNCAVTKAINQDLTLIHGPPGTGKTTVICKIINAIYSQASKNILVVAETNNAIDNIVKRLRVILPFNIIRWGTEMIDESIYDLTVEGQLRVLEHQGKKCTYKNEMGVLQYKVDEMKKLLLKFDIVLTTCAGAGDQILSKKEFDVMIVDEGTQTKETTLLNGIALGVSKLILVGDTKQIGPYVNIREVQYEGLPPLSNFKFTLFHRLFDFLPHLGCMLNIQYRMHPKIMIFPSHEFYGGKLVCGLTDFKHDVFFPWPSSETPLCFVDVHGYEERIGSSFSNIKEIETINNILEILFSVPENKRRLELNDMCVLTPYAGQLYKMKEKLKFPVDFKSIDSFQGHERDIIIISTVRANNNGNVGFSSERGRFNVMVTRAKHGLIVVGNMATLNCSDLWSRWLEHSPKLSCEALTEHLQSLRDNNRDRSSGRSSRTSRHSNERGQRADGFSGRGNKTTRFNNESDSRADRFSGRGKGTSGHNRGRGQRADRFSERGSIPTRFKNESDPRADSFSRRGNGTSGHNRGRGQKAGGFSGRGNRTTRYNNESDPRADSFSGRGNGTSWHNH